MTTQTDSNAYERGLELAEAGKYEAALGCIQEHLRQRPRDVQALNDAGAVLHCLGRSDEAVGHLARAHALDPDAGEIIWNLVEAYLAVGKVAEAAPLVEPMERMGILSIEVLNRIATMLLDQGRKGQAIEVLLRSRRLWPEQEVLNPMLEVIRRKRPKIALFRTGAAVDGALAETWTFLQDRFQTEFYTGQNPDDLTRLLQWCDIAWLDGGGPIAVEVTQRPRLGKMIVSLRCSDIRDDWVKLVRWEHVDILAQIGSFAVEETLLKWVPDIRARTRLVVVPNGINVERYDFQPHSCGKNLACIGRLTMEANPAFLLQCMQKLHYLDADYRLFFSGDFESPMLEQYTRHMIETLGLTDIVSFESYPSDLNAWLADKHFVVSSGIGEDQIEPLLVGMACGLKPIVHNFAGADRLFPSRYLFNIAEEFCDCALGHEYDPAAYRRFVEERYPICEQQRQISSILSQLEVEIDAQSPDAVGVADFRAPRQSRADTFDPVNTANLEGPPHT